MCSPKDNGCYRKMNFKYFGYVFVLIIFSVSSCSKRSAYEVIKSDQFKSELEALCDTKLYVNSISDIKEKKMVRIDFQSKLYRIDVKNKFNKVSPRFKQLFENTFKYKGVNVYYRFMCGKPPGYCLYQIMFQHKKTSAFITYRVFKKSLLENNKKIEEKLYCVPKYLIDTLIY